MDRYSLLLAHRFRDYPIQLYRERSRIISEGATRLRGPDGLLEIEEMLVHRHP